MEQAIIVALLGVFLAAAAYLGLRAWLNRTYERRIRRWCDENGYALVELKYRRSRGGLWPIDWMFSPGICYVTVQDEQGAQRHGWVHFGTWWLDLPWGKMQIRWE